MKIEFAKSAPKSAMPKRGICILGVPEGRKMNAIAKEIDRNSGGLISSAMKESSFTGAAHETLSVFTGTGQVLLYGLGTVKEMDALWCEKAGGTIVATLAKSGAKEASIQLTSDGDGSGLAIAERAAHIGYGALLRAYRFDKYRTTLKAKDKPTLTKLTLRGGDVAVARKLFSSLEAVASGVFFARDLVSEPPNVLFPESFANRLKGLKSLGVEVRVLGEKEMARQGMGALLGVGQGSSRESKFVIMRWNGAAKKEQPIAFVGKGVCFDTGGISLKPAGGMENMKWDMGGAAVVSGLMRALAARKAKANVVGVVGLVENMPDGNAQRPGDVVTSMSGQTIEIINTDAEGRLVLADALWYVKEKFKPRFMLDLATLTGAMMVSLAEVNCGYFANDDTLSDRIAESGKAVGEGVWRMPLGAEYNRMMDSDVADMKNAGPRFGGSITAACFLERFVGECAWSHMDIAGMAWSAKDAPTVPKGGTGWGVRLLNHMVATHYEG